MSEQDKISELEKEVKRLNKMLEAYNNPKMSDAKKVFLSLLREVPPETILVRYMSYPLTAKMVIDSLIDGTEEGQHYLEEALRVMRDLLAARSTK